jgi:cytochrome c oxidase subunit 1
VEESVFITNPAGKKTPTAIAKLTSILEDWLAEHTLMHAVLMDILGLGVLLTAWNVIRSLKKGAIAGPDPWKGNTLEWYTTSPPPPHNFDVIPRVRSVEPMKDIRRQVERQMEDVEAPPSPVAESAVRA